MQPDRKFHDFFTRLTLDSPPDPCYNIAQSHERKPEMFRKIILVLTASAALLLAGCKDIYNSASNPIESDADLTQVSDSSAESVTETQTTAESIETDEKTEIPAAEKTELPDNIIHGLKHFDQSSGYYTACESLSAVSLLQFYNIRIEPGEFISRYLPVADYPVRQADGQLHGESPWDYFIGDPMKSNGYGCYSGAIKKAMDQIIPGRAAVLRDVPLKELCENFTDRGRPVMIWATIDMRPTREGNSWILPDGTLFTYIRPEHALILIGADDDHYYFCDSHRDEEITVYGRKETETAYKAMQMQAIVIMDHPMPAYEETVTKKTPETEEGAETAPEESVEQSPSESTTA